MDRQTSPLVAPRLREMGSSRSRPVASHPSLVEKTDTVPLAPWKVVPGGQVRGRHLLRQEWIL